MNNDDNSSKRKTWMTLSIADIKYTVYLVDKLVDDHNQTLMGRTDSNKAEIYICDSIDEGHKYQTLVHEILHAQMFECGQDVYNKEELVNPLANVIFSTVKDNPKIIDEIKKA